MKFRKNLNLVYPLVLKKSKFPAFVYIPILAILLPAWVTLLLVAYKGIVSFLSFLLISWVISFVAIPLIDIFWFRIVLDEDKLTFRSLVPMINKKSIKQKLNLPFILGLSSFREHVIPYQEFSSIDLRRGEAYRSQVAIIHFYFGKEKLREFMFNENELNQEAFDILISTIAQKNPHVKLGNVAIE